MGKRGVGAFTCFVAPRGMLAASKQGQHSPIRPKKWYNNFSENETNVFFGGGDPGAINHRKQQQYATRGFCTGQRGGGAYSLQRAWSTQTRVDCLAVHRPRPCMTSRLFLDLWGG